MYIISHTLKFLQKYKIIFIVTAILSHSTRISSSSSRSALALVLLALQHSHIAPEVTYIHISNIYIYIYIYLPFGIIDGLVIQEQLVY